MTLTILICIVLAIQVILLAMVFVGLSKLEKNGKEKALLKRQLEKQEEQIRKLEQRQNKSRADNGDML